MSSQTETTGRGLAVLMVGLLAAVVAARTGTGLSLLETGFVAATLVTVAWWVFTRHQMRSELHRWSLTVGAWPQSRSSRRVRRGSSPAGRSWPA